MVSWKPGGSGDLATKHYPPPGRGTKGVERAGAVGLVLLRNAVLKFIEWHKRTLAPEWGLSIESYFFDDPNAEEFP